MSNETILVIDDDQDLRESIARSLKTKVSQLLVVNRQKLLCKK